MFSPFSETTQKSQVFDSINTKADWYRNNNFLVAPATNRFSLISGNGHANFY